MTDAVRTLKEWTDAARKIVFFGGAGVSTESGIPDFRSTGGLYHQEWKYPPETILSHTFYKSNPEEFFRFYRAKMLCPGAKPNAAHKKLAEWEREEAAGSGDPEHRRTSSGRWRKNRSMSCTAAYTGITAKNVENSTIWITSSTPQGFPGAIAAASSSRTWCSMRRP